VSSERLAEWIRNIPQDAIAIQFREGRARYVDSDGAIFFADPPFGVKEVLSFIVPFVQQMGFKVMAEDEIDVISSFPDGSVFRLKRSEHLPLHLDIYRWIDF
jgi:hypothetical protein